MAQHGQRYKNFHLSVIGFTLFFLLTMFGQALATQPPRYEGGRRPSSEIMDRLKSFTFKHAYMKSTARIRKNRAMVRGGAMSLSAAEAIGGLTISGTRSIPVLLGAYSNTGSVPFPSSNLQQELFDGPWSTGTMTDYYNEISYGQLNVTGTVFDWKRVAHQDTHYEGHSTCNGICDSSKLVDYLTEVLDLNDVSIDFGQYDNDGPDGLPNSGDDDGFVDFVAFVHPESGGECRTASQNSNMWSHRYVYSEWTQGSDYVTNDARHGGGSIHVDDYVIMPGLACDNTTMIQIGVFAHEFGHAFGLPDLYDTNEQNGDSEGIGGWGLMASGSWGGDNEHPETPSHMSAWSKEFLGWVAPTEVTSDQEEVNFPNIENNPLAFKVPISPGEYYLIENRQQTGFDTHLTNSGLLIWRINERVIENGLLNNSVNADEHNQGVELVEADGLSHLDNNANRGDAGDPFPGTSNQSKYESSPSVSVCQISPSSDPMNAQLQVTTDNCETTTQTVPDLSNQAQTQAETLLAAQGLMVGTVTRESHASIEKDTIIRHVPIAGTAVPTGSAIDLVVSDGPGRRPPIPLPITPPPLQGSISEAGEEIVFTVLVERAASYRIETQGATDTFMSLYGPDSETTLITTNDDIVLGGANRNSRIVRHLDPGTYHIIIRHYSSSGTGDFTISVHAES